MLMLTPRRSNSCAAKSGGQSDCDIDAEVCCPRTKTIRGQGITLVLNDEMMNMTRLVAFAKRIFFTSSADELLMLCGEGESLAGAKIRLLTRFSV